MPEQDAAAVAERAALGTEPSQVAATGATPVAEPTSVTPVAETPQLDLSTRDGIRKAAEQNPELAAWREEGFNAGRLKREKELREEQGSEEFARLEAQHWAEKYGVELDDADRKALPVRTRLAVERARLDQMRAIASEAKGMASSDEEAMFLQNLIDTAEGSADEMQKVATAALTAVANRASKTGLDSAPDSDFDSHPRVRAAVERMMAEEEAARKVEGNRIPAAPDAPAGSLGAVGMTKDRFHAMTPDARASWLGQSDENRALGWTFVG